MTAEAVVGLRWNVPVVLASAGILGAAIRPSLGAAPSEGGPPPRSGGAAAAAAWTLALVTVAAVFWIAAVGAASSPDLVFFWGAKAQRFALARTVDLELLRHPFHMFIHPYYPPLVTNVYALASMVAGRFVWMAAVLTFPLLLGALAFGLPGILRQRLGATAAAACSALAVAAIGYAGTETDVGGNGEMPLILFESLSVALLVSPDAGRPAFRVLAGILMAGAASSKVEGLPFVLAVSALVVARERAGARVSAAARLVAPTALALGAWFLFGATRRVFFGYSGQGRLLDLHPGYFGIVVVAIARALWNAGHGLPWIVPLAVLAAARAAGRRSPDSLLPLGTAAALVGFFLFTYMDRPDDPALWISWSAARIFMPVAMLIVIAAACSSSSGPAAPGPSRRSAEPSPR